MTLRDGPLRPYGRSAVGLREPRNRRGGTSNSAQLWRAVCVKITFSASTSIFLENLLTASTFMNVDLRFSRRRLKSASTFMNVDLRFHVDV